MKLHEKKELFADAIQAASRGIDDGGLGIRDIFIEKDYWICRSLRLMALADLLSNISQSSTIMDG